MQGCIFNVQKYSVHDGPGIRTVVFLKGCPLKCVWCANPESQLVYPQLAYNSDKCIGGECLFCQRVCEDRALFYPGYGSVMLDRDRCSHCLKCQNICPAQALNVYGKYYEIDKLVDEIETDMNFYSRSGGGLTLSGGEPLVQHEFATGLLKQAQKRKIHTAIETTGYAQWEIVKEVMQYVDYILFDIKSMHPLKHKRFTGVDNQLILDNFAKLRSEYPEKHINVRTPVIPGMNDTIEDIQSIRDFLNPFKNVSYELLKYHRFGMPKYEYLGREYQMDDVRISDEQFEMFKKIAEI